MTLVGKNKDGTSEPFVVKVQKSLMGDRAVLVYDESHTLVKQWPLTKKLDKEIKEPREFWWAVINADNELELHATAEEEDFQYDFPTMNPNYGGSDVQ